MSEGERMAEPGGSNADIINRFYQAFQKRDAEAMNACYAPGIRFSDPVFGALEGDRARAMWRMLAGRTQGLVLTYQVGAADDSSGSATWEAKYDFSQTGRKVDNHVSSKFWFEHGLIVRQEDTFDLWRWASMALGPRGQFLGWLPQVQGAIRKQAASGLDAFIKSEKAAPQA